jgi:SAM-dependent methyltransferase
MRAAATLMGLHTVPTSPPKQNVICDLGCGDGEFLIGLLSYLSTLPTNSVSSVLPAKGFGIDYNDSLILTATSNAHALIPTTTMSWLVYDFNLDEDDLFSKITEKSVTHMFVYLIPKQLALSTVRRLLERLWDIGVVVCCHKFMPEYLVCSGRDELMSLCVYEKTS